ncbi:hypothetical protein F4553_000591 [Allocatelliglobosispora scoriae]|uniref:Uncharacterized protein n=1 Tax=Allocatelliglobosispora scoriae TaxID=643052 RepID=A0A841BKC7_9ACTN|nr:hypothetical protein [Allocatelliglobosispora scoriae]MBB5867212.1 hypothetical protein [Allocatelliglobosispora scoriae]
MTDDGERIPTSGPALLDQTPVVELRDQELRRELTNVKVMMKEAPSSVPLVRALFEHRFTDLRAELDRRSSASSR